MITFLPWTIFLFINLGGFFFVQTYAKDNWGYRRIDHSSANMEDNQRDLFYTISTLTIFTLAIALLSYLDTYQHLRLTEEYDRYSILYFLILFFAHDGWVYFIHRMFSKLPAHQLHHKNTITTPLTAMALHPFEAITYTFFFIVAALIVPVHFMVLVWIYVIYAVYKGIAFLNYEVFPNSLYRLPFLYAVNPCSHHKVHRKNREKNFSCMFRFWDDQFNTMSDETHLEFYKVRFQIEKHKGHQEEKFRPHPHDCLGLYFEDVRSFKEDNQMVMTNFDKTAAVMVVDKIVKKFYHVHHGFCDGVSALKVLHLEKHVKLTSMPEAERVLTIQWNKAFIKDLVGKVLRLYIEFPYRKFAWNKDIRAKATDNEKNVALLCFTEEETKHVLANAKAQGVSLNLFLIYTVIKNFQDQFKNPNFFIPVWNPTTKMRLSEAPLRNNNSGFEFRPKKDMSLVEYKALYDKEMNGAGSFYWQKNFELLNIVFKIYFKLFVWLSLVAMRRTGTISNLGAFKGELKGPVTMIPPILHNCPFSVGVVTYNGELCIGVQTLNEFGPNMELVKNQLEKIRAQLIGQV